MKNHNRRDFIKQVSATGAVLATGAFVSCAEKASASCSGAGTEENIQSKLIIPKAQGLKISGTFLDEISHDIPHQNWGEKEWDRDFAYMKAIGIDTVIVIRSGYRKFITYPSEYLMKTFGCYMPSVDLIDMYLRLSDKYGMKFFFGLYDSGKYWDTGDLTWEIESNKYVIEEVWKKYGHHKSFQGWYLCQEISRATKGAIAAFSSLGKQCKEVSGGLPTLISPWNSMKRNGLKYSTGSRETWMPALSRTVISITMNWMPFSVSIRRWRISTVSSAGRMPNRLTGICRSSSSRSSSTSCV